MKARGNQCTHGGIITNVMYTKDSCLERISFKIKQIKIGELQKNTLIMRKKSANFNQRRKIWRRGDESRKRKKIKTKNNSGKEKRNNFK